MYVYHLTFQQQHWIFVIHQKMPLVYRLHPQQWCFINWVRHIWVSELTIISWDNGLLPGQCKAIIWTNAGILLIGPLGTNFCEILIEIHIFSSKKTLLKMSSTKCRSFWLGLSVLMTLSVPSFGSVNCVQCENLHDLVDIQVDKVQQIF